MVSDLQPDGFTELEPWYFQPISDSGAGRRIDIHAGNGIGTWVVRQTADTRDQREDDAGRIRDSAPADGICNLQRLYSCKSLGKVSPGGGRSDSADRPHEICCSGTPVSAIT